MYRCKIQYAAHHSVMKISSGYSYMIKEISQKSYLNSGEGYDAHVLEHILLSVTTIVH